MMLTAGSSRRQESSPADSVLIHSESDRRQSARVSQGVIPQAKIKTVKMTFVIVLGTRYDDNYIRRPNNIINEIAFYALEYSVGLIQRTEE